MKDKMPLIDIVQLIQDKIDTDRNYKRYDTIIEWENLFFDFGECEVEFENELYSIEDEIADRLYFRFRDNQAQQRMENMFEC